MSREHTNASLSEWKFASETSRIAKAKYRRFGDRVAIKFAPIRLGRRKSNSFIVFCVIACL